MITELTPEQEAQLEIYAKKWRDIGLSTEPANRPEAEKGVRLGYTLIGLPPRKIHWCMSPYEIATMMSGTVYIGQKIFEIAKQSVGESMTESVDFTVGASLLVDIRDKLDPIVEIVLETMSESLESASAYEIVMGRWSVFGYYDYLNQVLNQPLHNTIINGWCRLAQNAGWWLPCEDICYISERHNILNLDAQDFPHCEDGLAIGYPDGWGVYAWHGVRVPEYIIMRPNDITPDKIMSEENTEIARVMLERYGQDNFIRDGGFTIQQSDDYGDLYRVNFENGDEPIVAVKVKDASTDREYFLYVPPHIRTAHEGVAWSFGYDNPNDYQPDKET